MKTHLLERSQRVDASPELAFEVYGDALNLEPMTPPWLHFKVTNPENLVLEQGTILEYRLRLHGVPIHWKTLIETWEPPSRFVDIQLEGPYALWQHTHEFQLADDGSTTIHDRVRYAIPFGPLGSLANALFVRRDLRRIFDFRRDALSERLAVRS
jgi:ligand-binding SRPBCC domain-containing protein